MNNKGLQKPLNIIKKKLLRVRLTRKIADPAGYLQELLLMGFGSHIGTD